ncbi:MULTISPECIES: hypothetical protein [Haloarcula]|uniref:hypothetical protein n=1 Tax=Haloarcula TaxID=2237 RepID=UPI001376347E|nr:hypothetical protein [Haloarcula amylolytica]
MRRQSSFEGCRGNRSIERDPGQKQQPSELQYRDERHHATGDGAMVRNSTAICGSSTQ